MDADNASTYLTDYSSDLIGNIRTHLSGLQGFDVMALELIQNADDAGAREILFDIEDQGLVVRNDGRFTFCGDLRSRSCSQAAEAGYMCDFHRIKLVGSGNKRAESTNIGRFGIGFVSAYQVTDQPSIRSTGIELTLLPESQQSRVKEIQTQKGTEFFLPWATDPRSIGRRELGLSHITPGHIDRLEKDIAAVLRRCLLFLRHVGRAEIRRHGKPIFACQLERGKSDEVLVTFQPGDQVECWIILRTDAASKVEALIKKYPHLSHDNRNTQVSIALRTDPAPLKEGLLYAYLPTQQSSGLPLHINGDFYPEGDRKALIFSGHQHEQDWNEALIDAAADRIVSEPARLLEALGDVQLWRLIDAAYQLATQQSSSPHCFTVFWPRMQAAFRHEEIVLTANGTRDRPDNVLINKGGQLNHAQAMALSQIGGKTPSESLRSFQNSMNKLGAEFLNLEKLTSLYRASIGEAANVDSPVSKTQVEEFFDPLWSIAEDLLPAGPGKHRAINPGLQKFSDTPIIVSSDGVLVTPKQTMRAPASLNPEFLARILPQLAIAHKHIDRYPRLSELMSVLDLDGLIEYLKNGAKESGLKETVSLARSDLTELYSVIVDLDRRSEVIDSAYEALSELAIWPTFQGLISAKDSLLPGSFTDPLGDTSLLDVSLLSPPVKEFLRAKLRMPVQTVETFVKTVLPRYFAANGPSNPKKYHTLIKELANHASILDKEEIRKILQALPMVPTMNGGWTEPPQAYWRSPNLIDVLGDNKSLWVDVERVPSTGSVKSFLDALGIRQNPSAEHLAERIAWIASRNKPTEEAIRASGKAFYALCERYDSWQGSPQLYAAIDIIKSGRHLPAAGDDESWHSPDALYAPFRAEAFHSQAHVLAFGATRRLKPPLLADLGFNMEPETELVINHLLWCVQTDVQPSKTTYQILNERARNESVTLYRLREKPCIYVEQIKSFIRPSDLYWTAPNLGRYALTIPARLSDWKPLFDALEVKQAPDCEDFIRILMDIVGHQYEKGLPLSDVDGRIYERCLLQIAEHHAEGDVSAEDWERLRQAPLIRNTQGNLVFPDDVLFLDSHWCRSFFGAEIDPLLCHADAEFFDLLYALGVRRLSQVARIALVEVAGEEWDEDEFLSPLAEKSDVVLRLLHGVSLEIRSTVRNAFEKLRARSCDGLEVRGIVKLGGKNIPGPRSAAESYFDIRTSKLLIARPINQSSWDSALPSIVNQLIPEDAGVDIHHLIFMISLLLPLSNEDAHARATSAGIPMLLDEQTGGEDEDLASIEIPGLGVESDVDSIETLEDGDGGGSYEGALGEASETGTTESSSDGRTTESIEARQGSNSDSSARDLRGKNRGHPQGTSGDHKDKTFKKKWERRLLSYVESNAEEKDDDEGKTAHNYAVEEVARAAVCAYEETRGRSPEQMSITHPGYDIISVSPATDEKRFIEVKGLTGEWGEMGVSVSKYQFNLCRDLGESYWLYVVELFDGVSEPHVYAIQNPAEKVTHYMFDGNWREVATQESEDRFGRFIPGCRIVHKTLGTGEILSVETKGASRLLTVQFDGRSRPTPHVSLNLTQISVLRTDEN